MAEGVPGFSEKPERFSYASRLQRAEDLADTSASHAAVLRFYCRIVELQQRLHTHIFPTLLTPAMFPANTPVPLLSPYFPQLLALVKDIGTDELVTHAAELEDAGHDRWDHLLRRTWSSRGRDPEIRSAETFFTMALLQPYAEAVAAKMEATGSAKPASPMRPTCPLCESEPVCGILRPEGLGAKRSLLCHLCTSEWDYTRIVCPGCGEDRFEKISIYTAEQFPHVRIEACDTCQAYIKTIDLTKDGRAIPVVDEIASIPLDLWAAAQGYHKLQSNLLGM